MREEKLIRVSATIPRQLQLSLILSELKPWVEEIETHTKIKSRETWHLQLENNTIRDGYRELIYEHQTVDK